MKHVAPQLLRKAHERAAAACGVLQLQLGNIVRHGLAGGWLGKETGSSIDFHEHRPYLPGDDPRHIDWRVYARTDQYVMKQFREEISPRADIFLDCSDSMELGDYKRLRTFELLYFAVESAIGAQASVRCTFLGKGGVQPIDLSSLFSYSLNVADEEGTAPMQRLLHSALTRRSSLRIFISDLLFEEPPHQILAELAMNNGTPMIFAPYSQSEAEPDWNGNIDFFDCESLLRREQIVDSSLLARYHDAYRAHFELWRETCRRYHTPCVRVRAEGELVEALCAQSIQEGALRLWG